MIKVYYYLVSSIIDRIPEFETAGQGLISWLDQHLTKCAAFALQTSVNS